MIRGESNIGFAIKFVSNNQKSGLSCDNLELENKISARLNDLKKCLVCETTRSTHTELDIDIAELEVELWGGTMPNKLLFKELTPEVFRDWIHSISEVPLELKNSLKLEPYYSLIENKEERARFKCATDSYIKNTPKTAREALTRIDFADKVCTDVVLDDTRIQAKRQLLSGIKSMP